MSGVGVDGWLWVERSAQEILIMGCKSRCGVPVSAMFGEWLG